MASVGRADVYMFHSPLFMSMLVGGPEHNSPHTTPLQVIQERGDGKGKKPEFMGRVARPRLHLLLMLACDSDNDPVR